MIIKVLYNLVKLLEVLYLQDYYELKKYKSLCRDLKDFYFSRRYASDDYEILTDESRRKIISMLVEKDRSVNEIAKNFNKTQPCISHHLEVLKNAGIVESRKEGQFTIYSINMSSIQYIINWFMGLKDNK